MSTHQTIHFQVPKLTKAVKFLLISFVAVFFLQIATRAIFGWHPEEVFGFSPLSFLKGNIWQILTYPFLHGGMSHILFNALTLYFLGAELENRWGTKRFIKYYAVCAIGGALMQTAMWLLSLAFFPQWSEFLGDIPIIGASGALYGLFMAFGKLYGNAQVLVFFILPMKARHFLTLLILIEIFSAITNSASGYAHLVHLGGLLTGYLYLKFKGNNLDGRGGGFFKKRRSLDREEVRRRLNLIVNEDEQKNKDGKFPITWN